MTDRLHAMTRRHHTTVRRSAATLLGGTALVVALVATTACSGARGVLADAATAPSTTGPSTAGPSTDGASATPSATAGPTTVEPGAASQATSATVSPSPSTSAPAPTIGGDSPLPTIAPAGGVSAASVDDDADGSHATLPLSESPTAQPGDPVVANGAAGTPPVERVAELGGHRRTWLVVAPPTTETSRPRPLVILLHGLAADGEILQRALGFDPLADGTDVVLAYPSAIDGAWNDERPNVLSSSAHREHVDDAAFLDHIIDTAVRDDHVDAGRVAVVGFSNGGMMAAYYACVRADRVRAIALVAGAGGSGLPTRCAPSRPMSVLAIHSRRDPVVPFLGGPIAADTGRWGSSASVPDLLDRWRAVAACQGVVDRSLASRSPVVVEQHAFGCTPGIEIVLDRVESRVHGWLSEPTFMTTDIVWQFVVEHTRVPA